MKTLIPCVFLYKLIFFVTLSSQEQNSCNFDWKIDSQNENVKIELKKRLNSAFQKSESGSKTYSFDCQSLNKGRDSIFKIDTTKSPEVTLDGITSVVAFTSLQKCGNSTEAKKLKIVVACDPTIAANTSQITSIEETQLCVCVFMLATKIVCDPYPVADPKPAATDNGSKSGGSHFGGVGAFFLVVFLFICGYFLVGFLYKRYVAGAQGYEQIPHYLFLRRLLRTIQSPLSGTQYHRPSPNDPTYRNYDDGDEFRYDQPPLMPASTPDPSPTGGQNRFSSRPAAVNSTKDESDVRLLVV